MKMKESCVTQIQTDVAMAKFAHRKATPPGYLQTGKMKGVLRTAAVSRGVNVSWGTAMIEIVENLECGTWTSSNVLNNGRCQHVELQQQHQSKWK